MKKSAMLAAFVAALFFLQTTAKAEEKIESSSNGSQTVWSSAHPKGKHPGKKHRHRKHRKAIGLKKAIILKRRGLARFH